MSRTLAALEELARERTERDGLLAAMAATQRREQQARDRLAEARRRLAAETVDVADLESMSMTRILASLRGSRQSDLDRERAEAQAASYLVADAEARLTTEQRERASLEQRIAAYGDLDARRTQLVAERETEVRSDPAHADRAARLTELAAEVGRLRARGVQVEEADAAGREAHAVLQRTAQHLGSAGSWSTYDTFFGGGMLSSMAKHDQLDKAAALMRQADAALARLGTELADVGLDAVGGVGIDSMTRALDIWFDNIFTDWAVRERIGQASQRVHALLDQVNRVGQRLATMKQEVAGGLADAESERERLLLV
ncbi:hypothetical protein GCM10009623_28130 [Nocardioides aestuarii]|uniref:Uncharacterized protein n=1 Tax=Nocardioides aestuarii TaxID=252231 RepID=A0ABW4TPR4_9ACTN